jgi:hypothetical protein
MIDVIGAITLTVLAVAGPAALILASSLERAQALRVTALAAAWLAAVVVLGATDAFTWLGTPAVGLAVLGPVVIGALSAPRVVWLRRLALQTPVAVLIAIHVGRLLGGFFLALHAEGRLPATFARTAGWGDIVVALLAIPVAWMAARRFPQWRLVALLWNAVAFIDLATAVTLGIGSAQEGPLKFIVEDAVPGTINALPWILIPAFLVPIYLLTHLAVFAQLLRAHRPVSSSLAVGLSHR